MKLNTHDLQVACLKEIMVNGHRKKDEQPIIMRSRVVKDDPVLAQRIFYHRNDPVLGALFIEEYQGSEEYHNAAHFISAKLVELGELEQALDFIPTKDNPVDNILKYCFFEEDYGVRVREHGASERDGSKSFKDYFGMSSPKFDE